MKYQNGKEFYFLETPPKMKKNSSFNSKFKSNKKMKIMQKMKFEQNKEIIKNLSEGLNILEWLQNGEIGNKKEKTYPVKICFPMGFQEVIFEGYLNGISLEGQGRYKWLDGCLEYRGEVQDGLRHGRGLLVLQNPFLFYKGHFSKGLKEGKGLLVYSSSNIFKGFFKKGLRHGFGIMAYAPKGTPKIDYKKFEKNLMNSHTKKRKAQKFKQFFKLQMRNSVGSNQLSFNQTEHKDFMNVINILISAIKEEKLDEQNELKGIVLGVNKKDSLRRRWPDSVLLKDGQDLDFKDQTIRNKWKHDLFIGHWR
jgi:hypothetical protein